MSHRTTSTTTVRTPRHIAATPPRQQVRKLQASIGSSAHIPRTTVPLKEAKRRHRAAQWYQACMELDEWLLNAEPPLPNAESSTESQSNTAGVHTAHRSVRTAHRLNHAAVPDAPAPRVRHSREGGNPAASRWKIRHPDLRRVLITLSWPHQALILKSIEGLPERYFYLTIAARDHWSLEQLRQDLATVRQMKTEAPHGQR